MSTGAGDSMSRTDEYLVTNMETRRRCVVHVASHQVAILDASKYLCPKIGDELRVWRYRDNTATSWIWDGSTFLNAAGWDNRQVRP